MEDFIFSEQLNISQHYDLPFSIRNQGSMENAGTDVVICSSTFSAPWPENPKVKNLVVKGEVHRGLFFCLRPQNGMYRKMNFIQPFSINIVVPKKTDEEGPIRIDTKILDVTNVILMPSRIYTSVTMVVSYLAQ